MLALIRSLLSHINIEAAAGHAHSGFMFFGRIRRAPLSAGASYIGVYGDRPELNELTTSHRPGNIAKKFTVFLGALGMLGSLIPVVSPLRIK